MKKICIYLGFFLCPVLVGYGQFPMSKGKTLLHLTGEASGDKTKSQSTTGSSVNDVVLKLGGEHFFKENLSVGIFLIPIWRNAKLDQHLEGKGNGFTGAVYTRKYWGLSKQFALFGDLGLEAGYSKGGNTHALTGFDLNIKNSFVKASAFGGVSYFMHKNIGLQTDLDFASVGLFRTKVGEIGKPSSSLRVAVLNKKSAINVRFIYLLKN